MIDHIQKSCGLVFDGSPTVILVIILYVSLSAIVILGNVWLTKTLLIKGGIRRNGVEQHIDETFLLEMVLINSYFASY